MIEIFDDIPDLDTYNKHNAIYDRNPAYLVNDDMYITDSSKKLEVAKKIKAIYTNNTWEESPGSVVQVRLFNFFVVLINSLDNE